MSHYTMTPGQKRYLKNKYASEARNARCCDCDGRCGKCTGFVTGCKCDEEPLSLILERARNGHRERNPGS